MTGTVLRSTGLDEAVMRAFAPHPNPGIRVGLEIELIPDLPTYELHAERRTPPRLGRGVDLSVEPGGQVELSLGPRPSPSDAVRDAVRAIDRDLSGVFGRSIGGFFGEGSTSDRLGAFADLV